MASDYWDEWDITWSAYFAEVDKACHDFLRDRKEWSFVKYRWDNPDRMLSGPVSNGVWGNIHILFFPELSKFRFTFAAWRGRGSRHRIRPQSVRTTLVNE